MNFWRHSWSMMDWWNYPFISSNFKNFGFVDGVTREEIDDSKQNGTYSLEDHSVSTGIIWKYDNYAYINKQEDGARWGRNYISINWNNNIGSNFWGNYNGVNGMIFHGRRTASDSEFPYGCSLICSGGLKNKNGPDANNITRDDHMYRTFFIPLKNNGFFLNTRLFTSDNAGYNLDTVDQNSNPILFTSGKSYFDVYQQKTGHIPAFSTLNYSTCINLMGIPVSNNLIGTDFLYILLAKYTDGGNDSGIPGFSVAEICDGDKGHTPLLYHEHIPDFSQQTDSSSGSSQDPFINTHINFNRNTCTLIKYPYEATFLDNLFIMTTTPTTFTDDVGFFTINNRNFMKVFENIVVELPIN